MALLRNSLHSKRYQLDHINKQLLTLHLKLSNTLHPILWDKAKLLTVWRSETETTFKTIRHANKFQKLTKPQQKTLENKSTGQLKQVVYNISKRELDTAEESVLIKGFNFAVAPRKIPVENIICGVETSLKNLSVDEADKVRHDVTNILRRAKPPKCNLTKEETAALKTLKNDDSIIILPADKGNATVVMDIEDYHSKLSELLQDEAYQPINSDPTTYLEKTTRTKIKAANISEEIKQRIIPREKSSKCPKLYGLPKVHKKDIPLRPIVSSIGSPLQNLAKYLALQFQPYAETVSSYVRNSHHFIEIIKNQHLDETDILVSFDVVSLFTKVPINEALSAIEKKYQPQKHLIELAKHCLSNTYFVYNSQRYRQTEGAPMGSPLSPVIANLFMEQFETDALEKTANKPKLWLRYVDDTFVIWPHGREKLKAFLEYLNSLHPKIKFTMEIETENKLPFLDVLVYKHTNGTLGHTVYQKETHTNRYLHAESHHHPAQINSVIKTLIMRTKRLADEKHIKPELQTLTHVLTENHFNKHTITKLIRQETSTQDRNSAEEQYNGKAILPYIKGTTDKVSKILKKHNIKTAFTTDRKIANILRNPKDKIELENQGVYEIPCAVCPATYIGQTNRRIVVRREEHKNSVTKQEKASSLVQHINATGHNIDFENTKMIARAEYLNNRIIREAVEIEKRPHNMNKRDDALRLPAVWKPALTDHKISMERREQTDRQQPNEETIIPTESRTRPYTRSQAANHSAAPPAQCIQIQERQLRSHSSSTLATTRRSTRTAR